MDSKNLKVSSRVIKQSKYKKIKELMLLLIQFKDYF